VPALWDLSGAGGSNIASSDFDRIATFAPDDYQFALTRTFEGLMGGRLPTALTVFRDVESAEARLTGG